MQKFVHDGGKVNDFCRIEENNNLVKKIKRLTDEVKTLAEQKVFYLYKDNCNTTIMFKNRK